MAAYTITDLPRGRRDPLRWRARRLWRKITRRKPGTVTVTVTLDTTGFVANIRCAAAAADQFVANIRRATAAVDQFGRQLRVTGADVRRVEQALAHQRELVMVGGESRWYIRGAWAGSFVTACDETCEGGPMTLQEARELDRDIQVQAMLHERLPARWVAAYLRGWVGEWGNDDRDPYVRHTLIGGTAIEVSA